jgi:5'-nucleotidase
VSGINRGSNIGQDTLYSGTIAAAMEGCIHGIPAVAVSLKGRHAFEAAHYEPAVRVVDLLFRSPELLAPAKNAVLNVNVPEVPFEGIKGFRVAPLGRRIYDAQIAEAVDPRGRPYYWIGGGGEDVEPVPGTDCTLLNEHYVTLTALVPDHASAAVNDALRVGLAAQLDQRLPPSR